MRGFLTIISIGLAIGCQHRVEPGARCDHDRQCIMGHCIEGRCVEKEDAEDTLLEPSTASSDHAAIRLHEERGAPPVSATCAADERLLGGGCSGGEPCTGTGCAPLQSYPASPDRADTLGGSWHCTGGRGELTAHALCQSTSP